jgi:hypothetical protein
MEQLIWAVAQHLEEMVATALEVALVLPMQEVAAVEEIVLQQVTVHTSVLTEIKEQTDVVVGAEMAVFPSFVAAITHLQEAVTVEVEQLS